MKVFPNRKQLPQFLLRTGILGGLLTLGGCFMMAMPAKSHQGFLRVVEGLAK